MEIHNLSLYLLNEFIFKRLTSYTTSPTVWMYGFLDQRFCGWCRSHVRNIETIYEINSRYPNHRLTLAELHELGTLFAAAFVDYYYSPLFSAFEPEIDRYRNNHYMHQQKYWNSQQNPERLHTDYETIGLGF